MKIRKYVMPMLLLMLVWAGRPARTGAQELVAVRCYYPVNVTDRTTAITDSAAVFRTLDSLLSRGCRIDSVRIIGWASPEADAARNKTLSRLRAENLRDRLVALHPRLADHISVEGMGEDWEPVRHYLLQTHDAVVAPYRTELLQRIDSLEDEQAREVVLRQVGRGKPWRRIVEQACPAARYAEALILFCPDPVETRVDTLTIQEEVISSAEDVAADPVCDTIVPPVRVITPESEYVLTTVQDWRWALRTNLLVPAANVGVQWPVGRHFSLAADWYYPWIWPPKRNDWCVELLGLGLEGRWWLRDGSDPYLRMTGHSFGCTVMAGYYDFEVHNRGMQGEYLHLGVDYAWTFPVFRDRCRLTVLAGAGWLHSRFRNYAVHEPYGRLYRDGDWSEKLNWFGPTRLEVSLAIPFWRERTIKQEVRP